MDERLCQCVFCGRVQDRLPDVPDYKVACANCFDALWMGTVVRPQGD